MSNSNFVDYIKIFCRSGRGGGGSAHLHRAKNLAKGGPDGGDGGRGGHVILKGNRNIWTLLHLRYHRHVFASIGEFGGANNKHGSDGADQILEVPLGTVVRDEETGEIAFEITEHDREVIVVEGGQGGRGNSHFKTATNQTPRYAQPGGEEVERCFIIELKVLADIGLVGFPNAGKSTLLSVVSEAKPEIADYPFTTLVPNLGMVKYRGDRSFVMADIPGIIEGAHEGKGLGHRFLRHIERNSALLFMVPADTNDIYKEYSILLNELNEFNPELTDKQRILAISKSDMLDDELMNEMKAEVEKQLPEIPMVFISSVAGYGIQALKDLIWKSLNE